MKTGHRQQALNLGGNLFRIALGFDELGPYDLVR